LVLLLTLSTGTLTGVLIKQQAFRSAMKHGYFQLAHLFAKMGADPNGLDQFGETALIDAAWSGIGDGNAVNALVSMGANVNLEQEGALHGMLPSGAALHVAASAGRTEICNSLLQAGAVINAKNQKGETPLLLALKRGSIGCVPTLLEYGADVNARDMQGRTPLMFVMNYGPGDPLVQSILGDLIAKNADVGAKDAGGRTADDWAIYYKHEQFAEQLKNLPGARRKPH
jgi:ankyrin repeat protein